jgi:hypothetical protein
MANGPLAARPAGLFSNFRFLADDGSSRSKMESTLYAFFEMKLTGFTKRLCKLFASGARAAHATSCGTYTE